METELKKEIDKSVEITIDIRFNTEAQQKEVEMMFLDGEGNYTVLMMIVSEEPHIGDFGAKYRWVKQSAPTN